MDVDPDPQGFIGGLKLRWNGQSNAWVFGLEGDMSYADMEDSEEAGPATIPTTFSEGRNAAELSWLATLRLRAGLSFHFQ